MDDNLEAAERCRPRANETSETCTNNDEIDLSSGHATQGYPELA